MARAESVVRRQWDGLHVDGTAERIFAEIVVVLRSERLKAGLSQEALASGLPVRGRAVSEWETGAVEPKLGHLIGWSGELGLRLAIVGPGGAVCRSPLRQLPGESWEMFERRRLAWPLKTRRLMAGTGQTELGQLVGVAGLDPAVGACSGAS